MKRKPKSTTIRANSGTLKRAKKLLSDLRKVQNKIPWTAFSEGSTVEYLITKQEQLIKALKTKNKSIMVAANDEDNYDDY